jgi:hypothetical protein
MRLFRRAMLTILIAATACLAVGLTAPADAPFSIAIRASLVRVDTSPAGLVQPRALVLDVDLKCGPARYHVGWPGIPIAAVSTPIGGLTL